MSYEIRKNSLLGRHLVATRDIAPGETIMRVSPLVLGPKTVSPPLCLTCHKKLDLRLKRYECRKCRWPVCDEECESSVLHEDECRILGQSGYKPQIQAEGRQSVFSSIAPLRALLLKKSDPEKFGVLMECQAHLEEHRKTPVYQILKRTLVPFFTGVLKIDTDENEVLRICSVFDTNSFEVRDEGVNIRGLYPEVCLLAHDCKHNTKHSFGDDFELTLTATVKIEKGELITTTYTQTLWGTMERRGHLKVAKLFDCCCQRCKDPTELGTFLGSPCCDCGGKLLSLDPLEPKSDWCCQKCEVTFSCEEITTRNAMIKNEISQLDKRNPVAFEQFLDTYKNLLHFQNSFSLQVKYALSQMYGNMEGFLLEELPPKLIERKIQLCEELLEVAEVLEPGLSRFRGVLLYDLFQVLMFKVKKGNKDLKNRAVACLKEAYDILKTERDVKDAVAKKMASLALL